MLDRLAWLLGAAILALFGLVALLYVGLWMLEVAVRFLGLTSIAAEFLRWRRNR